MGPVGAVNRDEPSLVVYGRRPVIEALRGERAVLRLWMSESQHRTPVVDAIIGEAQQAGVPIGEASRQRLDELAGGGHHQGVVAEMAEVATVTLDDLLDVARQRQETPLLVVTDHLEDPQNLGSLIRSAEAAGAHGLVVPERRSVGVTPAVVRASAGATEHLAVASVVNLVRTLRDLKAAGLWIVGLDAAASQRYDLADLTVPLAIVVGSEGKGLSRLIAEQCDLRVRLPMAGRTASLNAAVAGAILLYETVRQRLTARR
jgi:23S rRNA (guanosine2251-2'-O)-methyltransferase